MDVHTYVFFPDDGLVEARMCWRYVKVFNKLFKN